MGGATSQEARGRGGEGYWERDEKVEEGEEAQGPADGEAGEEDAD